MNLPFSPYSKEKQLQHKRGKPTQKQMGAISNKVRKEVRERSGGVCEVRVRCLGSRAVQMAHIIGRKQIKRRTTANDLLDSCLECHIWLDQTIEGIRYKKRLLEGSA